MTRCVSIAYITTLLFVSSCSYFDGEILYCNPDDESWKKGAMHINLDEMIVYGGDTSSYIEVITHGDLVGFSLPFPILLFDDSVYRSELEREIVNGDFRFRFVSLDSSHSDWWVIIASPNETIDASDNKAHESSIILYSLVNGVLAMNFTSSADWSKQSAINFVPCGRRTLRFDDIRSTVNERRN